MDLQIQRINELARKAKQGPLSPEELEEQKTLRQAYAAAFRRSLVDTLEHTYIVDAQGNKRKVTRCEGEE